VVRGAFKIDMNHANKIGSMLDRVIESSSKNRGTFIKNPFENDLLPKAISKERSIKTSYNDFRRKTPIINTITKLQERAGSKM
jgi:hypothetical protein